MNRRIWLLLAAAVLSAMPLVSRALPSVKIGTAALITPTAANSYYGTATTSTNSTGVTGRPNEIVELARALNNNVDQIYDFVRNNVDVVWMYGLQKGALGTLIDRSGTPFDQAQLMVELLRQAGYTASYQAGTITLSGSQFAAWTNITNATAACQLLSSGAIPAVINGTTLATCGYGAASVSTVQFGHIWVSVTIGGTAYLFDPSYKGYTFKAGVNLKSVAGLTSGDPLTQAAPASTGTAGTSVPYIQNLNTPALNTKLQTYSTNLLNYIQTNLPAAEVDDLVGGRQIAQVAAPVGGLRQTTLPYTAAASVTWSGGIPDQYRSSLRVQLTKKISDNTTPTIIDQSLFVDEIYGRKLIFDTNFLAGGFVGKLRLVNDALVGPTLASFSSGETPNYSYGTLTLTVGHPYAASADGTQTTNGDYMDAVTAKSVSYATPMLIVHGWGDAGQGLIDAYGSGIEKALHTTSDYVGGCEICISDYFSATGSGRREHLAASWLVQVARAARIHASIAKSIYTLHHAVGIVYGNSNVKLLPQGVLGNQTQYAYTVADNADQLDVDSAFSLTSTAAIAADRRAAIHAIAATSDALEASVVAQAADLPDASSTATRFEWGNRPPAADDPSGTYSGVPRRFYQFDSTNATQANGLTLVEGKLTGFYSGANYHSATDCEIYDFDATARKNGLQGAINQYTAAGFTVVTSEEALLGPGQRCGTFNPHQVTVGGQTVTDYNNDQSKQRGPALLATRYVAGEPVEIASIVIGPTSGNITTMTKGGGGGAQTIHQAQYDPSQAAAILKSRFVDKTKVLGVDLKTGALTYTSPASLSVGNGGFPYELSAQMIWRGGSPIQTIFGPVSHIEPQTPWTTNWNSTLTVSSNGMEALGSSDVRASAATVAAFLAQQDVFSAAQTSQRDVAGVLVSAWWTHQIEGNVVTASVGSSTRQFVKLTSGQWIAPGSGPYATLTQTGSRAVFAQKSCDYYLPGGAQTPDTYILTRGWNYAGMAFTVTNATGDKQNFSYWNTEYHTPDGYCAKQHGFRLASWVFPQGISVNLSYAEPNPGYSLPELVSVSNTLGKSISFVQSGRGGFSNGLSGADARSVSFVDNADGSTTHTDALGDVTRYTYSTFPWGGGAFYYTQPYKAINQIYTPDNQTSPSLDYDYDSLRRVSQAWDGVALQLGTRAPYQFLIGNAVLGQRIDPAGNSYTVLYDLHRNPVQVIDELSHVTQLSYLRTDGTYDLRGRVHRYTYPENDQERLDYDDRNEVTSLTKVDKTGASQLLVTATYDTNCNKIKTLVDAWGNSSTLSAHTTTWAYDPAKCWLNSVTLPAVSDRGGANANPLWSYSYNGFGQQLSSTDPTGVVSQNQYDNNSSSATYGYLLSNTVDPGASPHLNLSESYGYDVAGNKTSVTDGRSKTTTFGFDKDRRQISTTGPASSTTACTGNLFKSESIYVGGLLTKTRKATKCAPNESTDADWQVTLNSYTPTKKPLAVMDASGYETITGYDALDRVSDVSQCLTASGSLASTCPGAKRTTHTTYYADGQVNQVFKGWGSGDQITYSTTYYTPDGLVDHVLDANNNSTVNTYDGFNRLFKLTFADGSYEQYGYDPNGNVTSKRNRDTKSITFTFDALNRETIRTVPANPAGHFARTLSTTYDLASRKYDATADGQTLQSRYDTAGRLLNVNDTLLNPLGTSVGNIAYAYDGNSNRTSLAVNTLAASWVPNYGYDDGERLQAVTASTTSIAAYTLDPLSRVTNEVLLDGSTVARTFFPNSDLQSLTHGFTDGSTYAYTYTVNGAHQIASQGINDSMLEMQSALPTNAYSVNNLNQYTQVGSITPTYDGNGNLTYDGAFTYEFDEENRLRSATGAHAVSYAYDPFGRRRSKTVDGTITYFISDGPNEVAELDATGARKQLYVYGDGADARIGIYTAAGGTWDIYHGNHQGSTIALSRRFGTGVYANYRYGPYGESADATAGNPFRYTGRYLDAETGLYYHRSRYYSSSLGRFLQTDPIGVVGDANLYAYVHDDAINRIDPIGTIDSDARDGMDNDFWKKCSRNPFCFATGSESGGVPNGANGRDAAKPGNVVELPQINVTAKRPDSAGEGGVPFRNPLVNLFRVVDMVELNSMAANRMRFLPSPNGSSVKYFWQNAATATAFGGVLGAKSAGWFTPPLHVVEAQISGNLINQNMLVPLADIPMLGSVNAVALPNEMLPYMTPAQVIGAIPLGVP